MTSRNSFLAAAILLTILPTGFSSIALARTQQRSVSKRSSKTTVSQSLPKEVWQQIRACEAAGNSAFWSGEGSGVECYPYH